MKKIKLKDSEIRHLLELIRANEMLGWYIGPVEQYWGRSDRIKKKLETVESDK